MAARKKSMGRGLGSLLEHRANAGERSKGTGPASRVAQTADNKPADDKLGDALGAGNGPASDADSVAASSNASRKASSNHGISAERAVDCSVDSPETIHETTPTGDKLRTLGIDQITRGSYQPRRHFDEELLHELAESLKSEGLIQPILVRPAAIPESTDQSAIEPRGRYELIAGERRWRAAQLAGFTDIPCIVRSLDDQSVAAVSLIENIQRKDLNPLEEAEALRRLSEEFGLSHKEVATSVGRSRSAVTNLMRLLDLHPDVKALVDAGEIDMGHARALLGASQEDQPELARRIVSQGMTVRAIEKHIRSLRSGGHGTTSKATAGTTSNAIVSDPDINRLEKHLGEKLGATVALRHRASGSGKLEITYHSMDELDGILRHIK